MSIEMIFMVDFLLWVSVMGPFIYFFWHVGPSAVRRWANEKGYEIVQMKGAGLFDWWSFASGTGHRVYRVVVRDKAAQIRGGLLRVGKPLSWSMSVDQCPVESRWDDLEQG